MTGMSSPRAQILQLTSLLPTAEHFCILLRDALRAQVSPSAQLCALRSSLALTTYVPRPAFSPQLPQMKLLKGFTASLYSEFLLAEKEEDSALNGATEGDARGPGGDGKGTYERGLGELFGFPGDAKKLREKSKIRLWKEYLSSASFRRENLRLIRAERQRR